MERVKKNVRKPKRLKSNIFVLYSPQRIILRPGEYTEVDTKLSVYIPQEIFLKGTLLPSLQQNGSNIENIKYISLRDNIVNIHQPVDLP